MEMKEIMQNSYSGPDGFKTPEEELDDLIFKVGEGNREAFASLYEKTKTSVYAYALSVIKNSTLAEDIMQDTYVNIAKNAAKYDSQGKPMAWILTIVRNLALMKMKASESKNVSLEECLDFSSQEDDYSNSDRKIILKMALDCLSDEERQIVVMHAVSGLKHREISTTIGMPLSTVLTKYNRALAKMKKKLGGDSGE